MKTVCKTKKFMKIVKQELHHQEYNRKVEHKGEYSLE